jgi:hypothetical protein
LAIHLRYQELVRTGITDWATGTNAKVNYLIVWQVKEYQALVPMERIRFGIVNTTVSGCFPFKHLSVDSDMEQRRSSV